MKIAKNMFRVILSLLLLVAVLPTTAVLAEGRADGANMTIASGQDLSYAIDTHGVLWAWGSRGGGLIGDDTIMANRRPVPVQAQGLDTGIVAITSTMTIHDSSHRGFTPFVLDSNGSVWSWEWEWMPPRPSHPSLRTNFDNEIIAISTGDSNHIVALDSNGRVWAWGSNHRGQLGDGSTIRRDFFPVHVQGLNDDIVAISAGGSHTVALDSNGRVWAWGANHDGQLGNGPSWDWEDYSPTPAQVQGLNDIAIIATRGSLTVAVDNNNRVWAWGGEFHGGTGGNYGIIHGDGSHNYTIPTPMQVQSFDNDIVAISIGSGHTVALDSNGRVWAWGAGSFGELGDGQVGDGRTSVFSRTPVQVQGLNDIVAIAAGGSHTIALDSSGSVWFWGGIEYMALYEGFDTFRHNTPVKIMDNIMLPGSTVSPPFTLPFPQPDLTEAQLLAITESLAGLLGGEISQLFQLSDDLHYVVIALNNQTVGGAVVREEQRGGEIIFHVEHWGAELLTEEQLASLIDSLSEVEINSSILTVTEEQLPPHIDILRETKKNSSFSPTVLIILSVLGTLVVVGGLWFVYSLGKKHAKPKDSE